MPERAPKVIVMGWFSFENGHATAGDLLVRDVVCRWLHEAGWHYDVATATPFSGGIDWRATSAKDYSHVVFVCGPFQDGELEQMLREHFAGVPLIGINLSMVLPLADYNPFRHLLERDSTRSARPDLAFLSAQPRVPVVGVCLVEPHPGGHTELTDPAVERLLAHRDVARVAIDTRLDVNAAGLRTPAEIESLIARMDAVVTTRMHGMVLALKNGVPAVAIDPEIGGFKITRQAQLIGWPAVLVVDQMTDRDLGSALDFCLTGEAQQVARDCAQRASELLRATESEFRQLLREELGR